MIWVLVMELILCKFLWEKDLRFENKDKKRPSMMKAFSIYVKIFIPNRE